MNSSGLVGDDLALLQLRTWSKLNFQLDLSEFCEASISPSRELLILLSHDSEALLLPLATEILKSEDPQEEGPLINYSTQLASGLPRSFYKSPDANKPVNSLNYVSASKKYPRICDVKSLAWGIPSNAYSQHSEFTYKDLLFVASSNDIIIHAFCLRGVQIDDTNSSHDSGVLNGRWIDWGPVCDNQAQQLTVGSPTNDLSYKNDGNDTVDGKTEIHNKMDKEHSSTGFPTQKQWLTTFFSQLDTCESGENYLGCFPKKESVPCSAEIVSFSIYNSTLTFLEFLTQNDLLSKRNSKEKMMWLRSTSISQNLTQCRHASFDPPEESFNAGVCYPNDNSDVGNSYKFSKVFSSSNHHLIGLVVTCTNNERYKISNKNEPATGRTSVIILTVYTWGIQWLSRVNIDDAQQGLEDCEWADFQFSDNFLVCLYTSGVIHVWDTKNGNNISHSQALQFCDPEVYLTVAQTQSSDVNTLCPLTGICNGVKDPSVTSGRVILAKSHGRKTKFKKLIDSSCPMLLGVLDDYGVVYVSRTGEYFAEKQNVKEHSISNRDPFFDVLSSWEVVRTNIGNEKTLAATHNDSFLDGPALFAGQTVQSHEKEKGHRSHTSDVKSDCYSSVFSSSDTRAHNLAAPKTLPALRRVFLPTDGFSMNDFICLSPYGVTRLLQGSNNMEPCRRKVVHTCLNVMSVCDETVEHKSTCLPCKKETTIAGEAIGCYLSGSFYLVTQQGLFVVLPSVSMPPDIIPAESIRYWQPGSHSGCKKLEHFIEKNHTEYLSQWQIEVLDKIILYGGPDRADHFCVENGWNKKISRIRLMQLALHHMKSDEIERCLEMLADVNLAEDGILSILFASVYHIFGKVGTSYEVAHAARMLLLAASFATKMIQRYGLLEYKKENTMTCIDQISIPCQDSPNLEVNVTKKFKEMAYFLEIIRKIQGRLVTEQKILNQPMVSGTNGPDPVDNNILQDKILEEGLTTEVAPFNILDVSVMKNKEFSTGVSEKKRPDTFNEVLVAGRRIAYELFLKGESNQAISSLQQLGEDIETYLRQLLFGTLRRSLRMQIAKEMKTLGYLKSHELITLDRISLIESLYTNSSFWRAYKQKHAEKNIASDFSLSKDIKLFLKLKLLDNFYIKCDNIDGVVNVSWANIDKSAVCGNDSSNDHAGYWACAAVWSDAWDERTVDRIVLDQPLYQQMPVSWESLLDYYMSHNHWQEIHRIVAVIPTSLLSEETLLVIVEGSDVYEDLEPMCMRIPNINILSFPVSNIYSSHMKVLVEQELARKFIFLKNYWENSIDIIPLLVRSGLIFFESKLATIPENHETVGTLSETCSLDASCNLQQDRADALHKLMIHHCTRNNLPYLLELYLDQHKLVLDKDSLLLLQQDAEGCQWAKWMFFSRIKGCEYDASFWNVRSIFPHNMALRSCPNVLDVGEMQTVDDMAEARGEMTALATLMHCSLPIQKCLCSGSVSRQCSDSFQCSLENLRPGLQRFPTLWQTLVSACSGQDVYDYPLSPRADSVFGRSVFTEYLIWRDGIFSSSGGDTSLIQMLPYWFPKPIRRLIKIFVKGPSELQSLSGSTPTEESFLNRCLNLIPKAEENTRLSAISWETAIQRSIEKQYSSLKENTFGFEHHLHRGRPLAAFTHFLDLRISELKSVDSSQETSGSSTHLRTKSHLDVQKLLEPCRPKERPFISSVFQLAMMHFEDSVLVASCAFLLEIFGISADILRIDIAVLRRISSYYKATETNADLGHISPQGSAFYATPEGQLTTTLARVLADDHLRFDNLDMYGKNDILRDEPIKKPLGALLTVLHHLEKASLPLVAEGQTCGSWLTNGVGDGHELRSKQKAASQHWNLVTTFCDVHHLPPSMKYLAALAKENDWVGFLAEAQIERIPFDTVIQLADEFSDPRLKMHILTVLKSMKSKITSSTRSSLAERNDIFSLAESSNAIKDELFGLIAQCERQRNPGMALLAKAKDMHWPLLAIIASCFPDVSPVSCLTVWLEISASREIPATKVNDTFHQIAITVGAAVAAANSVPTSNRSLSNRYNQKSPKRRRMDNPMLKAVEKGSDDDPGSPTTENLHIVQDITNKADRENVELQSKSSSNTDENLESLSNIVIVLSEQHIFPPLLRAFEMFLPSCSLLPFIQSLQAFCQMRLSESSIHLYSFSARMRDEISRASQIKDGQINVSWVISTAVKAADAVLKTCPSLYEKSRLLKLLAGAEFGDGGSTAAYYERCLWKINLCGTLLGEEDLFIDGENVDDASLLMELQKNGRWNEARNWAKQLQSSYLHNVTEMQADAMVAEWIEFLWDIPEERAALWSHCQSLFIKHSFPALQAGKFFLKHAEVLEKDVTARELHEMLLLSLQWLSGMITHSFPVYPLHLIREIETRIWLLAVKSESPCQLECDFTLSSSLQNPVQNRTSIMEQTARIISKMDNHINAVMARNTDRNGTKEISQLHAQFLPLEANISSPSGTSLKTKRRSKNYQPPRRSPLENVDHSPDTVGEMPKKVIIHDACLEFSPPRQMQEDNKTTEPAVFGWEEKVQTAELEMAVLSLLEFGQIPAARQLQQKLSPEKVPSELRIVDAALEIASSPSSSGIETSSTMLDLDVSTINGSSDAERIEGVIDPVQIVESLMAKYSEGPGRGLCNRIIAVLKASKVLCISFSEAFEKKPIELLQLLSLKAQNSFEEAKLLVQTHILPPAFVAHVLAESFLKGLLAAHRGGYLDSQTEEGPTPLLWRFSDFLKWAELCPSESEIGHALMRLVITSQDIPHACEVELLILSHHFYKSSSCLDGVDVFVTLAANRVESYVSERDFTCLARLVIGVGNLHALNFILGILIKNGQLKLLLHKYSAADATTYTPEVAVTGFQMAVLTSLKHFNPDDLEALSMVYSHFDMKHESAALLEHRSDLSMEQWHLRHPWDHLNEDLLESMLYLIEAAKLYSTIDAGQKAQNAHARATLIALQIRIPDTPWLELSETNARRALVELSRFQEAFTVAEAYNLNYPSEWVPVIWNKMFRADHMEKFLSDYAVVLPLYMSMLLEIAKFYRSEVSARGKLSRFPVWGKADESRQLERSFRSLLRRTRDLRVKLQLATTATGFSDIITACNKALDKVPETGAPLVLRKGHGGTYLPII